MNRTPRNPRRTAGIVRSNENQALPGDPAAHLEGQGYDILMYAGPVTLEGFNQVVGRAPSRKREKILALISTTGGDAHAAYRIARFLRRRYRRVEAFVPGLCKSAGTLLCVGADELVISETGELGPIDVQIREQNELFTHRSGLVVPEALDFLETKVLQSLREVLIEVAGRGGLGTERASQIAVQTVVGLYAPIYSKIDPAGLGEIARALALAEDYAGRLSTELSAESLTRLVTGYSDHAFVIDHEEAKKLFPHVRLPTPVELAIASQYGLGSLISHSATAVRYISRELASKRREHGPQGSGQAVGPTDTAGEVGPDQAARPGDVA
ncbi:MAG: hypothetical protein OXN89_18005 [Bryobacterales bacterium]|nr:hypothetical protein [Bryobacterales bacterium]